MESNFFSCTILKQPVLCFLIFFVASFSFLFSHPATARPLAKEKDYKWDYGYSDSAKESKVDFLEHIYFSGKNKDGLNLMILETLQDFEDKTSTASVAVQYTFLSNLKGTAENAKNACEIEDMLAAGIYSIDAREAESQNIPMPSKETNAEVYSALNAASSAGNSFGNAAYTGYYLSNGSVTAGRTAMTAYKVGAAAGAASETVSGISQAKQFIKGLNLSKDKPCKNVTPKNIEIANHSLPAQETTRSKALLSKAQSVSVSVSNVSFNQSKTVKSNISGIKHVQLIKNSSFANSYLTMTLITDLPISTLLDSILIVNSSLPFEVTSASGDEDANKQIQLNINANATTNEAANTSKDNSEKSYRDVNLIIMGISYDESKMLISQLGKKPGIKSIQSKGFVQAYTAVAFSTSIETDALIDVVKNIFPKINFQVSAATEEAIQLVKSE